MKVHLMYADRDFDPAAALPSNEPDLAADLELGPLLQAMAGEDQFLLGVARAGLHSGLATPAEITYRQHVLADCVAHPDVVQDLYNLAVEAVGLDRQVWGFLFRDSPEATLHRSRQLMGLYLTALRRLAGLAAGHGGGFRSAGFSRFFVMLAATLTPGYFAEMEERLSELELRRGTLMSARLGPGGKGAGYTLRRRLPGPRWRDRLPGRGRESYTFTIPERDDAGARALSDLASRGVNETANALAQSADHVKGFFQLLRAELGFYLGALSLRDRLAARGYPVCYPVPTASGEDRLSATGLYDASLALAMDGPVTGNDVAADGRQLIMITGANQGGKSTFLRSVGQAQLMLQAGLPVPARDYRGSIATSVRTHFKREEDRAMKLGKLDEELERMSAIADQVTAGGLLLCNESFASTTEREGSQLAREVIRAMTEAGIRVVMVTHLYDLAESLYARGDGRALFLRAQREPDGRRSYRLPEGAPLPTSHGEDLYREIFGQAGGVAERAPLRAGHGVLDNDHLAMRLAITARSPRADGLYPWRSGTGRGGQRDGGAAGAARRTS